LRASQQAWESATATKVSAEKAVKAAEAKAKKRLRRHLVMLSRNSSSGNNPSLNDSIVFRLLVVVSIVLFPRGLFTRACLLQIAIYFFRLFPCGAAEKTGEF
jgi:hypothetical protein